MQCIFKPFITFYFPFGNARSLHGCGFFCVSRQNNSMSWKNNWNKVLDHRIHAMVYCGQAVNNNTSNGTRCTTMEQQTTVKGVMSRVEIPSKLNRVIMAASAMEEKNKGDIIIQALYEKFPEAREE